jgi:hypothetical protein
MSNHFLNKSIVSKKYKNLTTIERRKRGRREILEEKSNTQIKEVPVTR